MSVKHPQTTNDTVTFQINEKKKLRELALSIKKVPDKFTKIDGNKIVVDLDKIHLMLMDYQNTKDAP